MVMPYWLRPGYDRKRDFSEVPVFGDPRQAPPVGGLARRIEDPDVGTTDIAPRGAFSPHVGEPAAVGGLAGRPAGPAGPTAGAPAEGGGWRSYWDRVTEANPGPAMRRFGSGLARGIANNADYLGDLGAAMMVAGAPSPVRMGAAGRLGRALQSARQTDAEREDRNFARELAESADEIRRIRARAAMTSAQASLAKSAEPKTRSRVEGGEFIYEEKTPGAPWQEVSRGPRWNPDSQANDSAENDTRIQAARKLIEGLSQAQRESITDPFFADQMGPAIKQALYWSTRPVSGESADQAAAWASQYAIPQLEEAPVESSEAGSIYEDEEPSFWSGIRGMIGGGDSR